MAEHEFHIPLTCSLDDSMLHFCRLQLVSTNATLRDKETDGEIHVDEETDFNTAS